VQYALAGVKAEFTIPGTFVKVPGTPLPHRVAERAAPLRKPQLSGRVLIVEDNMIIALDAESTIESLGASLVDVAPSVNEALRLIEMGPLALALLDVNLGSETSFPIADRLLALGVPVVFATGYGKNIDFPERFAKVPVVSKPYNADTLGPKIAEAFALKAAVERA
jgi:CheY-like chemotaxis protein